MRAQAVLDTATAGKMAAVAASAAALAGGGAAAMHDATDVATPLPRAAVVRHARERHARPSVPATRTAVVRTRAPAPSSAARTAASQHAHRPAPAARPQTEFIAETAATGASAASRPTTQNAPSGGAGGTEFGLESP
jgi:hypothetical protein